MGLFVGVAIWQSMCMLETTGHFAALWHGMVMSFWNVRRVERAVAMARSIYVYSAFQAVFRML